MPLPPSRLHGPIMCVDYHTGGEPFRIVTGGVPPLEGRTVLERRGWAADHLDDVRRLLVNEPRGHADMYGCFVTPPDDDGADLGVVFFHNEGYSTACGHGTIALVTWAIDEGLVSREPAVTRVDVGVDVPSGRVACVATLDDVGNVTAVAFRNVPSFVLALEVDVATSRGTMTVDVAFGGAFYASLDVRSVGLAVTPTALPELIALQRELRPALEGALDIVHPLRPELRGLYGVIFWEGLDEGLDGASDADAPGETTQRNVTVFADGEVDRSPCGSGTSARLAILHARGAIAVDEPFRHRSIVDSAFVARVVAVTELAGRPAVLTEVEGAAYRTGGHTFTLDRRDPLGTGFLLR